MHKEKKKREKKKNMDSLLRIISTSTPLSFNFSTCLPIIVDSPIHRGIKASSSINPPSPRLMELLHKRSS